MDSETYFGDQGMTADVCERRREKPPPQQLTECDWRFFYPSEQVSVDETRASSRPAAVRGPKPAAVLYSRKVRIDCAASDPFTTHEVFAEMHGTPLRGKRVVV